MELKQHEVVVGPFPLAGWGKELAGLPVFWMESDLLFCINGEGTEGYVGDDDLVYVRRGFILKDMQYGPVAELVYSDDRKVIGLHRLSGWASVPEVAPTAETLRDEPK